jgi:hypothetical protein
MGEWRHSAILSYLLTTLSVSEASVWMVGWPLNNGRCFNMRNIPALSARTEQDHEQLQACNHKDALFERQQWHWTLESTRNAISGLSTNKRNCCGLSLTWRRFGVAQTVLHYGRRRWRTLSEAAPPRTSSGRDICNTGKRVWTVPLAGTWTWALANTVFRKLDLFPSSGER